jgi:hypothetical protein
VKSGKLIVYNSHGAITCTEELTKWLLLHFILRINLLLDLVKWCEVNYNGGIWGECKHKKVF